MFFSDNNYRSCLFPRARIQSLVRSPPSATDIPGSLVLGRLGHRSEGFCFPGQASALGPLSPGARAELSECSCSAPDDERSRIVWVQNAFCTSPGQRPLFLPFYQWVSPRVYVLRGLLPFPQGPKVLFLRGQVTGWCFMPFLLLRPHHCLSQPRLP